MKYFFVITANGDTAQVNIMLLAEKVEGNQQRVHALKLDMVSSEIGYQANNLDDA